MKFSTISLFVLATAASLPTWAQSATGHDAHHPTQIAQATPGMTAAEVRKVDKDAGKITLKHEAIPNVEMPPMTMVFRVSDPKLLDRVKAGDKVQIAVEKVDGQLTVTKLEPTP